MNPAFVLLLLVACQLCSAQDWEETSTSSTPYSSSSVISSSWSQENTASLESAPLLDTTATSSSASSSSSWEWKWGEDTTSSSVTSSTYSYSEWWDTSSTSSIGWDWNPAPTSSTSMASSSVPSIETLFVFMYEALERDHLGLRRKRRDIEAPILPEKSDPAFREEKKKEAQGFRSKDFVKEMLRRAMMKKRSS